MPLVPGTSGGGVNNPYSVSGAPLRPDLDPGHVPVSRRLPYSGWWAVGIGALTGLVVRLIYWGDSGGAYDAMLGSFIFGSPLVVGAVTVYMAERIEGRSWGFYFVAPFLANVLYIVGTLLIMVEGWICAIVIVPLFSLLGGLAGLAMGLVCRLTKWPRRAIVSSVALLPLIGGAFEHRLKGDSLELVQDREIVVAATPDQVWRELIDTRDIRPDEVDQAWMYRIGVPTPRAGIGDFNNGEHLRHVTMGKGVRFDQVATEWQENRRVTWAYRFSKDSFPPGALDDHVRIGGRYFDVIDSTYTLVPDAGGTRLHLRMHYRVSTHWNWYAAPVANLLVGDFAEVILDFYAHRATGRGTQPVAS